MKNFYLCAGILFIVSFVSSCVSYEPGPVPVRRISMLSIKNPNPSLVKVGTANEKYCSTEDNALVKHGFVDELVTKALNKYNGQFIDNAVFTAVPLTFMEKELSGYNFGNCWTLEGDVMRLK